MSVRKQAKAELKREEQRRAVKAKKLQIKDARSERRAFGTRMRRGFFGV